MEAGVQPAVPGQPAEQPADVDGAASATPSVGLRGSPGASPRLPSRKTVSRISPQRARPKPPDDFTQGPNHLVSVLASHLEAGAWGPVVHTIHLANFLAQCKPFWAKQLAAAGTPTVLIDVMDAALASDPDLDVTDVVMQEAAEMLLFLVETDQAECTPDILTTHAVSVLIAGITSPASGTKARQFIARLLRRIVSSGSAWRGPLLAHGGLEGLARTLLDPVAASDLVFLQEVLWAVLGLVDAAVSGAGELAPPPPSLLPTLVPLLQLLQLPSHSHLSHVAALVARVLHVTAAGDDVSKQAMGRLGVVPLLVRVLKEQQGADDDAHGLGGGSSGGGASSDYGQSGGGGALRRAGSARAHRHVTPAPSPHDAALSGVNVWDRISGILLLRAILGQGNGQVEGVPDPVALASYALLPPVLVDTHTPENQRLCLLKEAVVGVKTLVADAPPHQDQAVAAGAISTLVNLVAKADVALAWQAADALGQLAAPDHVATLLAESVVEELTQLLQESADALHLLTVRKQLEDHAVSGTTPVLPTPHAAYAHRSRDQARPVDRVQLIGKQRLSFACGACMYSSHDQYTMCDYCVPSACLRSLLAVFGAATAADVQQAQPPGENGLAAALPPITAGQPPTRGLCQQAGSRLVAAGGLYSLFLLLHHELSGVHHSKMAASMVSLLNLVLDAGLDIQDEVRKVGGLALLISLVESMGRPRGVTDIYQLRAAVCVALTRLVQGNSANKLMVRERGLIPLLTGQLRTTMEGSSAEVAVLDDREQVLVGLLDLLTACLADSHGNQDAFVAASGLRHLNDLLTAHIAAATAASMPRPGKPTGAAAAASRGGGGTELVLTAAVHTMARLVHGNAPAQLLVLGSPLMTSLITLSEPQPAGHLALGTAALASSLIVSHPQGKAHIIGSGLLGLLLKMLGARPVGHHVVAATQGLYSLCVADVDLQNEVVAQGGLIMVDGLLRGGGPLAAHGLWLLTCLLGGNSYVKNSLRGPGAAGLLPRVVRVLSDPGLAIPELTLAAAHALAAACQSNHGNQEAVAEEGALEAVAELLHQLLEPWVPTPPTPAPVQTAVYMPGPNRLTRGTSLTDGGGGLPDAEEVGGMAAHPALLDALLRLLAALLEFNASNQRSIRESGCLSVVAAVLLRLAGARTPGALRRLGLLPAAAACCSVLAAATQDNRDNQGHLVYGHEDLAPALFCMLSTDDAVVAYEAARALEHLIIRSDMAQDAGETRADFERDAVRSLVNILHTRGGPPGAGTVPGAALPAAAAAALHAAFWGSSLGTAAATATAGGDGPATPVGAAPAVTAATAKEAAAVLLAVVTAAEAAATAVPAPSFGATGRSGSLSVPWSPSSGGDAATGADTRRSGFARIFRRQATTSGASSQGGGHPSSAVSQEAPGPAGQQPATGHAIASPRMVLPDLAMDPASGLVTTSSMAPHLVMPLDEWLRLAAQSAAAFQPVAALVSDGTWRAFKVQLAWMLFLLALRSESNRRLVSKLEKNVVAPVAAQLANAESFFASAEAAAAMEASEASSTPRALPVSVLAQTSLTAADAATMSANTAVKPGSGGAAPNQAGLPRSGLPRTASLTSDTSLSPRRSVPGKPSPLQLSPDTGTLPGALPTNGHAYNNAGAALPTTASGRGWTASGGQREGPTPRTSTPGQFAGPPAPLAGLPPGRPTQQAEVGDNAADDDEDDDDDLAYLRREAEMLAGVSSSTGGAAGPSAP